MQTVREQAIEFIKSLPDDKIVYMMDMFRGIRALIGDSKKYDRLAQQSLLAEIKEIRGIVPSDIDEKARDEKYANTH